MVPAALLQPAALEPPVRFALQEVGAAPPATALDRLTPGWRYADIQSRAAPGVDPRRLHAALKGVDMGRAWIMRLMLSVCTAPALLRPENPRTDFGFTFRDLERFGFTLLADEPAEALIFGLIGRFWTPSGDIRPFAAEAWDRARGDLVKLALGFHITETQDGSRIDSEIRAICLSDDARWIFSGYWPLIRPLNAAARRQLLRAVTQSAGG